MKVYDLLDEIEEIVDTATNMPLTGKIMVDPDELLEIVKEIRTELPQEMKHAHWLEGEQARIEHEARENYEMIIEDAKNQAESMVNNHEIVNRAREKAESILSSTAEKSTELKLGTYEYVDGVLFNFQEKLDELNGTYIAELYNNLETTFTKITETITANREEIKSMAYEVHQESLNETEE